MNARLLYKGSVKDIYEGDSNSLIFSFSDRYSVFDWGEMPDQIPGKGEALARFCLNLYRELEDPRTWIQWEKDLERDLDSSYVDFAILKNLQKKGLSHHLLGYFDFRTERAIARNQESLLQSNALCVKRVDVPKPHYDSGLKSWVYDPELFADFPDQPKLLPFEWIFRLGLPQGSSFLERLQRDPSLKKKWNLKGEPGEEFSKPWVELSTKHEPVDRILDETEARRILGEGFQEEKWSELFGYVQLLAAYLKTRFKKSGLFLWDGKVELAMDTHSDILLVDSIGPDELRVEAEGVQLNKEYIRQLYRKTTWFEKVQKAKAKASNEGLKDWKKVFEKDFGRAEPPGLSSELKDLLSKMYGCLADCMSESKQATAKESLKGLIPDLRKNLARGL